MVAPPVIPSYKKKFIGVGCYPLFCKHFMRCSGMVGHRVVKHAVHVDKGGAYVLGKSVFMSIQRPTCKNDCSGGHILRRFQ